MAPMECTSWFIAPMEKAWFYKRFFIKVVMVKGKNVMVKDKTNTVKDKMSIKNSFLHYMKWTAIMLPVVLPVVSPGVSTGVHIYIYTYYIYIYILYIHIYYIYIFKPDLPST